LDDRLPRVRAVADRAGLGLQVAEQSGPEVRADRVALGQARPDERAEHDVARDEASQFADQ
jgi:hypothetical protein